jgi:hypothetical protein
MQECGEGALPTPSFCETIATINAMLTRLPSLCYHVIVVNLTANELPLLPKAASAGASILLNLYNQSALPCAGLDPKA